jgi:hypothetical protein
MSEFPDSDGSAEGELPSQAAIDLQKAVAAEEDLLAGAPSLDVDGPRVHEEVNAGPTEETEVTAYLIEESLRYGPQLSRLDDSRRNPDDDAGA